MPRFISTLACILFLTVYSLCQEYKSTVYNLSEGTVDTLYFPETSSGLPEDYTSFYIGSHNSNVNQLEIAVPTENLWEDTHFTRKQKAADDYNLEDYPIRTSIKLFRIENDSLKQTCSGSIISGKHVLTAAHCVVALGFDTLRFDSLLVSPVYNNGKFNRILDYSRVDKVYVFKNGTGVKEDIAILELEKPLGNKTGWIGIGYNENDSLLGDGIFYKFSYPGITTEWLDSNQYNGDTLYYSYGVVNDFTPSTLGVKNYPGGIKGESGSSIIKIGNASFYVSYGVLSYSNNLRHSRITASAYQAIKEIISPYLEIEDDISFSHQFYIFPNPSANQITIEAKSDIEISSCSLYTLTGIKLLDFSINTFPQTIDVSHLAEGYYMLRMVTGNKSAIIPFTKAAP